MWAWIQDNQVRDICPGDPELCYHPDIAKHYDTQVPDGTENGATLVDGEWVNPLPPVYVPSEPVPPTVEQFDAALTAHLDAVAQARRYDNRITCMVRAGFAGPYQKEAIAFAQWCDGCNASAYQLLTLVQQGKAPMPSSIEAFLESLPVMVWPA